MATKIEDSTIKKKKDYFKIKNLRFVLEIYPNLLTKTSYKVIIYILDILNKNEIIIKKQPRLLRDHGTGKSRGIAFIECPNKEVYEKCLKLDRLNYEGRKLRFNEAN